MSHIKINRKNISVISIILIVLLSSFFIYSISYNHKFDTSLNNNYERSKVFQLKNPQLGAQETFTRDWFENPDFEQDPIEPTWYSEEKGDVSDVRATTSPGQVNNVVIGDSRIKKIDETLSDIYWNETNNPKYPIEPDNHGINASGCFISHTWDEGEDQSRNTPSMQWKRNISMDVNMSDYIITSASLDVNFSALVQADDHDGGGVEVPGDYTEGENPPGDTQFGIGDFVTFYAQISDLNNTFPYTIASNRTTNLGRDSPNMINSHPETPMNIISEDLLVSYLTSALQADNYNFSITLGIDIYCEDNEWNADIDKFLALIITVFNLTFAYEKKIDQITSVSWNQDGKQISDISSDTVIVEEALLNFKYKIDDNWTDLSPNSEIRAYINTNKISETIKLSKANSSWQDAKVGGINVKSLIPYNAEIKISIQVYLADKFNLDKNITISFDDIHLTIKYTVYYPDSQTNLQVFFNGVNKTSNPIYNHSVGFDLNITVKYPDDTGAHIPDAIVELSGNFTRTFKENDEQYTVIIQANELNIGTYNFKIVAHKIGFKLSTLSPIVTVIPTETQPLQLFLNGDDKTLDPLIDVPLNSLLNITIKYHSYLDTPITGASIFLSGEGILENLNESLSLNQYSIIINSSVKLLYGINLLTIKANKLNYEEQLINPIITVRKINSIITPVNKTNKISILPEEDATLQVYINNTDFNEIIKGAVVTYTWEKGEGILEDLDNDGIYEVNLTNIPAGTHSVVINAFGSDKYNFVSLEIIIVATKPGDASFLFRALLIVGIVVSIALGGYLYAYQKILKFPKTVRKVRKYGATLRRKNVPKIDIQKRKNAFNAAYVLQLRKISKFLKRKPKEEKPIDEKIIKKQSEVSKAELTKEPRNLNTNSYHMDQIKNNKSNRNTRNRIQFKIRLRNFRQNPFKFNKFGKHFYIIIILVMLMLSTLIIFPIVNQNLFNLSGNSFNSILYDNVNNFGISAQDTHTNIPWLNNSECNSPLNDTWYPSYGEFGDNSDILAINNSDYLNYTVIGDSRIQRVDQALSEAYWDANYNPDLPVLPDTYLINSSGCYVSHLWDEGVNQTRNRPSVHWNQTINMPSDVNMTEYIITSASLEVIFNATVTVEPRTAGGIDRLGDPLDALDDYSTGDYAEFYVLFSDIEESFEPIQTAYNNTALGDLGQDDPRVSNFSDTPMNTVSENILIDILTSVLGTNGRNFTITLGIDIYCEDNEYGEDEDKWDELIIRSFNLTFTYEKKIDQFTSASWNQDAGKISDLSSNPVVIDSALLYFNYSIDQDWISTSPNSEIRILINDNLHPETVKLSSATNSFQEAKVGGFDLTALVIDDVKLSIEVYLADEFSLDRNITISIDDIFLNITYTIIYPDEETDLYLFLNSDNKTDNPNIDINIGDNLNITVKYLNKTGAYIPNATVQLSGNFTGRLDENESYEQYTIVINTDASDAGVNFLTISAQAEDYETRFINLVVSIKKFSTEDLIVILSSQNKTQEPYIEVIKRQSLNVTVKYTNLAGSHISGASVLLRSESFTSYLNESTDLEQYSIIIDTNKSLKIGTNYMTIEAQAETFQTKTIDITVVVRKINVVIKSSEGSNSIETKTGKDIRLAVYLNNTDFGGLLEGALVTYSWEGGVGVLTDLDNDGIYETTIESIPEGTFPIEITALAGDDYIIEDYEFIVAATSKVEAENILFPILFTVSIIVVASLVIYLYAYQTYLKYPKQVRKVRKYRKSLNRAKLPSVPIIGRESAFKSLYNKNLSKLFKLKPKPTKTTSKEQKEALDKIKTDKISQKLESGDLIDKSLEKKQELDKLVNKTLDKNT